MGRFLEQDPLWPLSGINSYEYSINAPINFDDPEGLFWINFGGAVLGGAGAAIGNIIAGESVSITDTMVGAIIGFIRPTASFTEGSVYGYLSHLINPPEAGKGSDERPLPPDLQALVDKANQRARTQSNIPFIDQNAGLPQYRPAKSCP